MSTTEPEAASMCSEGNVNLWLRRAAWADAHLDGETRRGRSTFCFAADATIDMMGRDERALPMSRENGNPVVAVKAEGPAAWAVRLAARVLAVVLLAMVAFFAVYEGIPNPFRMTPGEWAWDGAFLVMTTGLLVGLRYARIGGALVLAGYAAFIAAAYAVVGHFWLGHSVAFAIAGALFVLTPRRKRLSAPKP